MGKIKIIILREYLTRVKKKSFIVMTFLGPILMAGIWVLPFILATMNTDEKEYRFWMIRDCLRIVLLTLKP